MKFLKIHLLFLLLFCLSTTYAQINDKTIKTTGVLLNIHYGVEIPTGILADRFGTGFSLGLTPVYMTSKQWFFGVEGKFLFGAGVYEDVLSNLRTADGEIIGQNKSFAVTVLNQRGYFLGGTVGKLITFPENEHSGIRVSANAGILRHKVRIDDSGGIPQLTGDYRLGYDRLTYGLGFTEFIGYQRLSKNGKANFYAGMEFTQGFTKNRRTVNYDTGLADTALRKDILWGFQVGWVLSLYDATKEVFY